MVPADGVGCLYWSDAHKRTISVRPRMGGYEWSAPFKPERLGEQIIKLRPLRKGASLLYIRCSISLLGSRRDVTFRQTTEGSKLPYEVVNDSLLLLAVRQPGCSHVDLLGIGESLEYALDLPDGERSLVLTGVQPSASLTLEATTCSLDRLGRTSMLRLLDQPQSHARTRLESQSHTPVILMASSASLRYGSGDDMCAAGWLVLTPTHLTFIYLERQSEEADVQHGWLPRSMLPIPLAGLTVEAPDAVMGESTGMLTLRAEGGRLEVGALRSWRSSYSRIDRFIRSARALAHAAAVLEQLRTQPEEAQAEGGSRSESTRDEHESEGDDSPVMSARGPGSKTAWVLQRFSKYRSSAGSSSTGGRAAQAPLDGGVGSPRQPAQSDEGEHDRLLRYATCVQAAFRRRAAMRAMKTRMSVREPLSADELLCRPPSAVPIDGSPRAPSEALVAAVAKGDAAFIVERLLQQRADPDSVDPSSGLGAVHVACMHNQLFLLSLLLSNGADIEAESRDKLRSRPLHVAIRTASFGVGLPGVKLLLALGADPTASRADGVDSLELATHGSTIERLLLSAITMWKAGSPKRKATVSLSLWSPSELPDSTRRVQRAAIVHAAAAGRRARVSGLLRHTDPNSQDEHGIGAIHVAAARGDVPLLQALLAAGASPNLPTANTGGARPLHCAAHSGSVGCVKALLRASADPLLADLKGHLPVERAAAWAHAARGELLQAMERLLSSRQGPPSSGKLSGPKLGGLNRPAAFARAVLSKQGPVRVLLVTDRDRPSASPAAEEPVTDEPSESAGRVVSEMTLSLAGIGVSLIDAEPCELLRASLQDVRIRSSQSEADRNLELIIGQIQVDCCIEQTKHPVVLQPMPSDESERDDADVGDCILHLVVTQNVRWTSLLYIEHCEILLLPMRLTLEQNMTARLLRLSNMLVEACSSVLADGDKESATEGGASQQRWPSESADATAGADTFEIYLRFFKLHPVVVGVTVQMDALCDERGLQAWHPVNSFMGPQQLFSLQNTRIEVNCLELNESSLESLDELITRIVWHYTWQVLQSVYKQVLSLEVLGNPASIVNDMTGGVREFFYQPARGLVKSPAAFAKGVFVGTRGLAAGGLKATGGFVNFVSAAFRIVDNAAGVLTLDKTYQHHHTVAQQRKAQRIDEGLKMGFNALGMGVKAGVVGVVTAPITGAMDDGARGFAKGLGRGLIGVFAKPLSGMAAFASKTTEGIASEARRIAAGSAAMRYNLRMRQPRSLAQDGVLRPYPPVPPLLELEMAPDDDAATEADEQLESTVSHHSTAHAENTRAVEELAQTQDARS